MPGIGSYRALLIASEVLPIERFAAPKHLVSYAGLAPRSSSTGLRRVRYGSIPAGANRWLRGALVRAVVSHMQHAPESWLSAYYAAQKERLGWRVTRIAAARKLARALHAMLRTGECWKSEQPRNGGPNGRPNGRPDGRQDGRGELLESHVALTTSFSD